MINTYNQKYIYRSENLLRYVFTNIRSQCTCQYDVIMKNVYALQLQREADHVVFDDKNGI